MAHAINSNVVTRHVVGGTPWPDGRNSTEPNVCFRGPRLSVVTRRRSRESPRRAAHALRRVARCLCGCQVVGSATRLRHVDSFESGRSSGREDSSQRRLASGLRRISSYSECAMQYAPDITPCENIGTHRARLGLCLCASVRVPACARLPCELIFPSFFDCYESAVQARKSSAASVWTHACAGVRACASAYVRPRLCACVRPRVHGVRRLLERRGASMYSACHAGGRWRSTCSSTRACCGGSSSIPCIAAST